FTEAYNSIKDIHYVVPTGRFIRNIHRWSAHLMLVAVLLHMARVFYTSSYRKPREWNWVIGIGLLFLTFALSFTGYLLPWDQLAYWAMTIGANIAASPREVTDALGVTQWFDIGGITKDILLGSKILGEESILRFYFLHCIFLPVALVTLMAIHFWRIRKDGGLSRPEDKNESAAFHKGHPVFHRDPQKTYGLMAVIRGTSPNVGKGPENTLPSWPNLMYAEIAVFMICTAIALGLGLFFDAPLKELANPNIPENPAKAPWYFLGLQEIVSYSAFFGGVFIPTITMLGLALIPYLDREERNTGIWFTNGTGKNVFLISVFFSFVVSVGLLAFTVKYGWLRAWYPDIPQIVITLVNPGTLYLFFFIFWSLWIIRKYDSVRIGAIALFTCFLVSFSVLTFFATYMRGPNWDFYWWPSLWPIH
ncbi:MAG: cytochrome b N-terminal domain-containing protein, partial [Deltaproteobacteria bacterium]|nr:cytochrome b N-terminal domain-containing protein [Deltaproteobacteria bacterium]